ncbi:MAG: hypothetical protein ABIK44_06435 [candidate division WOR-3 bacterium]
MQKVGLLLVAVAIAAARPGFVPAPKAELFGSDNVPMFINYQGYLTDTTGVPITATLPMTFTIFSDSAAGSQLWTQSQTVSVQQGVFNVKLILSANDTSLFMAGARRWIELRVNGFTLRPRTEITSMAYGIRSVYSDNSDMLDMRHASDFIYNGTTRQPNANYWISGWGRADVQLSASAVGLNNSAAVIGSVSSSYPSNIGVYGYSPNAAGVYGNSQNSNGVYGLANDTTKFGVWGVNSRTHGTGVAGTGCNDTLYYLTCGTGGTFCARHIGLYAYGHDTTGTGIAAMGQRIHDTVYTLAGGSGGAFNGTTVGVYGCARNLTGDRAGGYFRVFSPPSETTQAWVAFRFGGQSYKILGNGTVSTIMATRQGQRILFAPEAPEAVFEDFGEARLVDGHCRVELDPLFLDCCVVDDAHPLRVFVTLTDNCNGVYVKADTKGFDVYELNGGRSSAGFFWRAIAARRGSEDIRLPVAPAAPAITGIPVMTTGQEPPPEPVR